jgi:hypothetical protein
MKLYILDKENNPLGPYDADLVRTWIARDEISPALPARIANDDGTTNDNSPTSTVGELLDSADNLDAANAAATTDRLGSLRDNESADADAPQPAALPPPIQRNPLCRPPQPQYAPAPTFLQYAPPHHPQTPATPADNTPPYAQPQPYAQPPYAPQQPQYAPPPRPPLRYAPRPRAPQAPANVVPLRRSSSKGLWLGFTISTVVLALAATATAYLLKTKLDQAAAPADPTTTSAAITPASAAAPADPANPSPASPVELFPDAPPAPPIPSATSPSPSPSASDTTAPATTAANTSSIAAAIVRGRWQRRGPESIFVFNADNTFHEKWNKSYTGHAAGTYSITSDTSLSLNCNHPDVNGNIIELLPDGTLRRTTRHKQFQTYLNIDVSAVSAAPEETTTATSTSTKKTTAAPSYTGPLVTAQENASILAAAQKIREKVGTKEPFLLRQIDAAIERIKQGEPFYADRVVFVEKNDPLLPLKKEFWLLKVSHDEAVRKTLGNIRADAFEKINKYIAETLKRNPEHNRLALAKEARAKFSPLAKTKADGELARLRTLWSSRIEDLRQRTEAAAKKTSGRDDYFFAQLADALKNTCVAKFDNLSPDFTPFNADDVSLEKPTGFLGTCFEERKEFYKLKIARDLIVTKKQPDGIMPIIDDPIELEIKESGRPNPLRKPNYRTENKTLVDANPMLGFYITEQEMKHADERLTPLITKTLDAVKSGNLSAVTSNFERLGRTGYGHKGILFSFFFTLSGKESMFAYIYRHLGKDADAVARKTLDAFLATRKGLFVGDTAADGIQYRMRALLDTMKANGAKGISSEPEAKLLEGHLLMLLRSPKNGISAKSDPNPDGKFNDRNQLFSQTHLGNCSMMAFYRGAMFKPQFKDQIDKRRTVKGDKVVWDLGGKPYTITNKDLSYLPGFGAGDTDARSLITALNYEYLGRSTFHYGHQGRHSDLSAGRNDGASGARLLFSNYSPIEFSPHDNERTRQTLRAASNENVVVCAGTPTTDYWIEQYGAIPLSVGIGYTDIDDLRKKIDQWNDALIVPAPGVVKAPNTEHPSNPTYVQTLPTSFLTKHHTYQLTAFHAYTVVGMKGDSVLFINTGGNVLQNMRFTDFVKYFDKIYGVRLPEDPKYAREVAETKKNMVARAVKETHYNAARVRAEVKRLVGVKDQLRLSVFNTILANNGFVPSDNPKDPRNGNPYAVGFYPADAKHAAAASRTAQRNTTNKSGPMTPSQERAAEAAIRRYAESIEPVNVELAGLARNAKELKDTALETEVDAAIKTFLVPQEMMFLLAGNDRQNSITWTIANNVGNKANRGMVGTYGSNRVWSIALRPNGTGECLLTVEPSALQRKVFRPKTEPRQNAQQKVTVSARQNTSASAQQNPRQANRRPTSREREEARSEQIEDASKFTVYVSPFSWKLRAPRTLVIEWGGGIPPDPVMGKESAWTLRDVEAEWQFKYGSLLLIGEEGTPYTLQSTVRRSAPARQKR